MSVVINTNYAATLAANNLASSSASLQRSLNRLASGSKIIAPQDDAAGLAVSMKLSATARRQNAVSANLGNAVSYLQTQDGALQVAGKVLSRIGELKTLYADPTKNSADLANYQAEFTALQAQLTSLSNEKFNGKALFGSSSLSIAATADADGDTIAVGGAALMGATGPWSSVGMDAGDWTAGGGASFGVGQVSFHSTGTFTSNQTISGGFTLSFSTSTLGSASYNPTTITAGGATLNLGSFLPDASDHNVVIVDDGVNATISVDGGPVSSMATLIGGGALVFSSDGSNFPTDDLHITNVSLSNTAGSSSYSGIINASSLGAVTLSEVTDATQEIATLRAANGAQQSRLQFADEVVRVNKANIEAANSRITDVDVAEESTTLARYNILVQSGAAMLSQANQSAQMALRLLG